MGGFKINILHVSPVKNKDSILKYGLIGQEPLLGDVFKDQMPDRSKGAVFGLREGSDKQDKYLQDAAYWKIWGDPRNIFLKDMDYELYCRYQEQGVTTFNHIKTEVTNFAVFEVEIIDEFTTFCYHLQYQEMGLYWLDMNTRYEHFKKPLIVVNDSIKREQIKLVGSITVDMDKRGNINTNLEYHKKERTQ